MEQDKLEPTRAPGWVATPTGRKILDVLSYVQSAKDFGLIHGGAGLGKTHTLRHYAKNTQHVFIVTMSPDTATAAAALEEVFGALGMRMIPSGAARMRRVLVDALREEGGLLVVDEAQHLSVSGLETFRSMCDCAGIGLALVDNEYVYSRLTGGARAATFAQISSRVGIRLPLSRPLKADAVALADAWGVKGERELSLLWKIAQTHGALRMMVKTLTLANRAADQANMSPTLESLETAYSHLAGEA